MGLKQVTYLVNGEKIRLKDGVVTGPEHLMEIIRRENERLQDNRITCVDYIDLPPGDLADSRALLPLMKYIFGDENASWDESEPTLYYEGPPHPDRVY
jgi:hypothetical protein